MVVKPREERTGAGVAMMLLAVLFFTGIDTWNAPSELVRRYV